MDILFTRCFNPTFPTWIDIGTRDGKIAYLKPSTENPPKAEEVIDLGGKLLLPGLVESHIHLDKAYLLEQLTGDVTTLRQAIEKTTELKHGFTATDIEERSLRVIRQAVAKGVTRMRCHVEIDPISRLMGMETTLALKEQVKDSIDLQIVAFPQEGIFNDEETKGLMEQAMEMGADVVGGITYNDRDLDKHLDFVFRLAEKYGKPVDLHVDFSDNADELAIMDVIRFTHQFGMQGRVSVGHLTSLGSVEKEKATFIAKELKQADIQVISLPATDLYLNGRGDKECVRRGLTPVKLLLEYGVKVIYGSNNIQNAFTPFGTADPLDIGFLLAQTSHMGREQDARQLIDMVTNGAARSLGFEQYGLQVGAEADLIVCPVMDIRTLLYTRPERERVYKSGKLVAETTVQVTNHLKVATT
ncbi:N-acyl-D-amino acid deacylase [Alkalihalobacillus alcalophilus ATCC 27647 = CGMCC 1.3604]|uniref:Cytosine deaminase n=1 Tax=Alkalihalobacillus alcalophilus ATCC 27647 = CGMCC 1.3604 TaxID=1218173 RepID=A0A094WJ42_ALKAL|nr:amidohydrolase family protein [Alkalihalobacillus alcalophilus]KGA95978.1 cytosine deaminase [Alkalihalobacillus alcalophilus ATCC 27647 = CGMCC 1.3604]MED1562077.1 amidohydrolase family protein [Alkalihalobacillus alcalophilus]THG88288.1 N-acyl-D-amino acid deacylase [Alkalihalobacillus alcalophilus ATCC 27647 = CGMCC 1.3604]